MVNITSYGSVTRYDLARTLAGRGRYWTTAYRVGGLLIDAGCAHAAPELEKVLAGIPLHHIINTHSHEDHIGANGRLQRRRRLAILAHPRSLPVLDDPRGCQPLHPYRRLFWGWPEPCQARPLADGEWVETDEGCFQVIYTPGHAADHLCLWEPEQRWLFSGDLFVGGRDRAARQGTDFWGVIASLERIAALPVDWLFPGSARARQKPAADIAAKIGYYKSLGDRIRALHQQGCSVAEIIRQVCGGRMWIELVTLGHFARVHLVESFLQGED